MDLPPKGSYKGRSYIRVEEPWPTDSLWPPCRFTRRRDRCRVSLPAIAKLLGKPSKDLQTIYDYAIVRHKLDIPQLKSQITMIWSDHLHWVLRELNLGWTEDDIIRAVGQFRFANAYIRSGGTNRGTPRSGKSSAPEEDVDVDDEDDDQGSVAEESERVYTYPPAFQKIVEDCEQKLEALARETMESLKDIWNPQLKKAVAQRKREVYDEMLDIVLQDEERKIRQQLESEFAAAAAAASQKKRKVQQPTKETAALLTGRISLSTVPIDVNKIIEY